MEMDYSSSKYTDSTWHPERSSSSRAGRIHYTLGVDGLGSVCGCGQVCPVSSDPIYPTPPLGKDMTQGQFLSGVKQVWIQSFPSRLVASPMLKNLVCPTIYPKLEGE